MPFEPINWLAVYCIFVVSITSLKHIPIFLWLQIAILLLIFVDACWICDFVDDIDEFYSCWHIFWCFSHLKPLPFFRWLFSILIEFRIFIDDFDPPGKFIISCLNPDLFLWFSLPPQIFSILQPWRGRQRRRWRSWGRAPGGRCMWQSWPTTGAARIHRDGLFGEKWMALDRRCSRLSLC